MQQHQFLWFDLETTGLDPRSGLVLEYAAVLAADGAGGDYTVIDGYTDVIHHDAAALAAVPIDDYVRGMHERNGLWSEVDASTYSTADVDARLARIMTDLGARPHSVVLAGHSVHFDLAWARVHMPLFTAYLSHRVFDVSTLRAAAKTWAGYDAKQHSAHRAHEDVIMALAEMVQYKRMLIDEPRAALAEERDRVKRYTAALW